MRKRGFYHKPTDDSALLRRVGLLCAFMTAGILLGQLLSGIVGEASRRELAGYLSDYGHSLTPGEMDSVAIIGTLSAYFRCAALLYFSTLTTVGTVLIPLVCFAQGLELSFSVAAASIALGDVHLALVLWGIRCAVVLPCGLFLGSAALRTALLPTADSRRMLCRHLTVSTLWLLCGAVLELYLVPRFL